MEYTLFDLLSGNLIPGAKLLTKRIDASQVFISSVSVQELPIDDFIRENEMVLSTAVGCLEREDIFLHLIREVGRSGASVLFLAFKDPTYLPFPSVIQYANEMDLPIFVIPWEHRFSHIQETVTQRILEKRTYQYKNLQEKLLDAFFEEKNIQAAVDLVGGTFRRPAALLDENKKMVVMGRRWGGKVALEEAPVHEAKIYMGSQLSGYLCFYPLPNPADTGDVVPLEEHLLTKYVCFPLSLWINQKRVVDLTTTRLRNDFIWNLASGNYDSPVEMIRQGAKLSFDLALPYTCVSLKAVPVFLAAQDQEEGEYSFLTAADSAKIEERLIQEGKDRGLKTMASSRNLDFILYLENDREQAAEKIQGFVEQVHGSFTKEFPSYRFFWGLSETSLGRPDFPRLYENAQLALRLCLQAGQNRYQLTYQDAREAQILQTLASNQDICKMAGEILQRLEDYTSKGETDLMGTLVAYIQNNYNVSKTARALYLHRQTLLYRLGKIESLLDMSLDNHQNLFLLEICLHIVALNDGNKKAAPGELRDKRWLQADQTEKESIFPGCDNGR